MEEIGHDGAARRTIALENLAELGEADEEVTNALDQPLVVGRDQTSRAERSNSACSSSAAARRASHAV
jgi:hypothetical protein